MKYACMYCQSPEIFVLDENYKENLTIEELIEFMAKFPVGSVFEVKQYGQETISSQS